MTDTLDIAGPCLTEIAPDDAAALAALAAEQRARLLTIRRERIWQWLGGLPGLEVSPSALFGVIAFLLLVPAAVITAGFTQGFWLWILLGLAFASVLPWRLRVWPVRRRTLAFYQRGELRPAVVLAAEPEACNPDNQKRRALHLLVGGPLGGPAQLQTLLAAGNSLAAMVAGRSEAPAAVAAFAAAIRDDVQQHRCDGSRTAAPAALGQGLEYARVSGNPTFLPEERLTSRLLFAFVDPAGRGPGSSKVLQSSVWGGGVRSLCAAFPWEVQS
jgi:hypothetical protein